MKINGVVVNIREVVEVVLHRTSGDIKLKVSGWPIGINRLYMSVFPRPVAPKKATGKVTVKDGPEVKPDYDDPKYSAAIEEFIYLEKFFMICKCLEVDESIKFEANYNTLDGLRKIPEEMNAAGFTEGDVGAIFTAMRTATTIEPKALDEAAANFT